MEESEAGVRAGGVQRGEGEEIREVARGQGFSGLVYLGKDFTLFH